MVFSSLTFIFLFLPIFLILYYIVSPKRRNALLFIGSLVFYSLGEPYYLLLILISVLVNYRIGRLMDRSKDRQRFIWLMTALLYNFGKIGRAHV